MRVYVVRTLRDTDWAQLKACGLKLYVSASLVSTVVESSMDWLNELRGTNQ